MIFANGCRRAWALACLSASVVAASGCALPGEEVDAPGSRSDIIGGAVDDVDTSVVLLLIMDDPQNPTKQSKCSATIVSPHVAITAAHCLSGLTNEIGDNPYIAGFIKTDIDSPDGNDAKNFIFGKSSTYDPGFNATLGNPHDFGVVVFEKAVTLAPIPLHRGAPPDTSTSLHLVGYGLSDASNPDSFGVRKSTDATPVEVNDTHIGYQDSGMCGGDSGGPTFSNGEIVGIHSWGEHISTCTGKFYDILVDADVLAFVDPLIEQADPGFLATQTTSSTTSSSSAGSGGAGGAEGSTTGAGGSAGDDDDSGCSVAGAPGHEGGASWAALGLLVGLGAMTRRARRNLR